MSYTTGFLFYQPTYSCTPPSIVLVFLSILQVYAACVLNYRFVNLSTDLQLYTTITSSCFPLCSTGHSVCVLYYRFVNLSTDLQLYTTTTSSCFPLCVTGKCSLCTLYCRFVDLSTYQQLQTTSSSSCFPICITGIYVPCTSTDLQLQTTTFSSCLLSQKSIIPNILFRLFVMYGMPVT